MVGSSVFLVDQRYLRFPNSQLVLFNYPQVKDAFDFLSENKEVNISGTGSSMFTKINSFEEGKEIMDNAPRKLAYVITNTINKSPLLNELLNSGV